MALSLTERLLLLLFKFTSITKSEYSQIIDACNKYLIQLLELLHLAKKKVKPPTQQQLCIISWVVTVAVKDSSQSAFFLIHLLQGEKLACLGCKKSSIMEHRWSHHPPYHCHQLPYDIFSSQDIWQSTCGLHAILYEPTCQSTLHFYLHHLIFLVWNLFLARIFSLCC